LPKDISSLQNQMLSIDVKSPIIDAVIKRNNEIDRVEQDWKKDEGRAFINS
jgi:UDP-glucose 6-dehydrogenase